MATGDGKSRDELVEIRDSGIRDLAKAYLERRQLELAPLRSALRTRDFEALWEAGHRMQGSGGSYGLERLAELGAALEEYATAGDGLRASRCLDELEAYLGRVSVI